MTPHTPRILKYVFVAFGVLTALLLLFINSNLAALAGMLYPGSALWTHMVLLTVEFLAFGWLWWAWFGRPRHLLLMDADTPEERRRFAKELVRRMRNNPLIRQAGLVARFPDGQDEDRFLDLCLRLLKAQADTEIQQNARRIFLATALSQNGKLDALIMFVSLCRLVWRISAVYNQRPHPREVVSLYGAVISSTFLALSIEELDISTEITVGFGEAFHAMAPAGLTASIPFAGKALQTFTAAAIDGAANCYLGLRAGIITRNAYTYGARQTDRPSRTAVYKEAGALLLGMSQVLMSGLAATLADGLAGAAGYAGRKTVLAGKGVVGGIGKMGSGIGRVGSDLGASAGKVASDTVNVVQNAGGELARLSKNGSMELARIGKNSGTGLLRLGKNAGNGFLSLSKSTGNAVGSAVDKAASAAMNLLRRKLTRKKIK